jgi:hypothetical protein
VDKQFIKQEKQFLGSGWAFPVTFSFGNYELNLSAFEDNVNHSIDAILKTRMGERCMEPNFGSGVQQYFFRQQDATLQGEITDAVKAALLHNEPRITVLDVQVNFTDMVNGFTEVTITYAYNQTNSRHNYVFPFYIKEGTNLQS